MSSGESFILHAVSPVPSASPEFVEELYGLWKRDRGSVSRDWDFFFQGFEAGLEHEAPERVETERYQSCVDRLIDAYRSVGHLAARTDPLGEVPEEPPDLTLAWHGLSEDDLSGIVETGFFGGPDRAPLGDVVELLRDTYCRTVGVEYQHNHAAAVRAWLRERMEPIRNRPEFPRTKKTEILENLIDAEVFENFIQRRYPGQKRFSLEGAESLIPALHHFMEIAGELGIREVFIGMAHRGRLNVLANILNKPYSMIFYEFEDIRDPDFVDGDADVKYHRGFSSVHKTARGAEVGITLTANPSHLEAVDPVVEGQVRARQRRLNDLEHRRKVVPLLIHGDAAFSGQGLVAETFNLSQLKGYRTGGTVHIVVNNQIGFTTEPEESRSTQYPTDVAKMVSAPIFHVNGDDPEAVIHVVELALRYRQEFSADAVVDLVCYRRHGHNEGDEPSFTQPLLYKKIRNRPPVRELYTKDLLQRGELTEEQEDNISNALRRRLDKALHSAKEGQPEKGPPAFKGLWKGLDHEYSHEPIDTSVDRSALLKVARALTAVPPGFKLNKKIARHLPERLEVVEKGGQVDWPYAELLSLGSLLSEELPVRFSGQDSRRGTFSQRHSVWQDVSSDEPYVPLNHIHDGQARFCVYNSMLSEAAVLGFDYGYSLAEPNMLVIWEAQFGDFVNGAQVIIDQFLTTSESKWQRTSGLVLLLPHGYEGQGPEHSNAYLERYLAACAEDNLQVANLSTPANYFHALRRQVKRNFRRPLIVMSPKSLLRHPLCLSDLEELTGGGFREVLPDPDPPQKVRRLAICSGKVFYDLLERRREMEKSRTAIVRLEQFYPFPSRALEDALEGYSKAESVVWVQEEPQNRGGWTFIEPRLRVLLGRQVGYVGRPASASPATGSLSVHKKEQQQLVEEALA